MSPEVNRFSRFLELPPEIRQMIYAMVLKFPLSGLRFRPSEPACRQKLTILRKDLSTPLSPWPRPSFAPRVLYQSVPEALYLLLVNKQIFSEAFPLFYGENLFYFDEIHSAYTALRSLPAYRRQHIGQLAIDCCASYPELTARVFSYIGSLPKLRTLHISIDEAMWMNSTPEELSIHAFPGLTKLRALPSTIEIFFHGCPNDLAQYLENEIRSKKRKSFEGETIARRHLARAAKVGRKY